MNSRRLLPFFFLLILAAAFSLPGCDELVTERIENTVYDSTLGIGCYNCHSDSDNRFLRPKGQWENSKHASALYIDTAIGCGEECHSHEGYIKEFDSVFISSDPLYSTIGCFTCHSPHSYDYQIWDDSLVSRLRGGAEGGFLTLANGENYFLDTDDKSIMCVNCHKGINDLTTPANGATSDTLVPADFGAHNSIQADVIVGTNAFIFTDTTTIPSHKDAIKNADGCLICHFGNGKGYSFGEHTFNLADDEGNHYVNNCNQSGCHSSLPLSDFNSPPKLASIKILSDSLEAILKSTTILDENNNINMVDNFNPDIIRMLSNYLIYERDGSFGVHNPNFINQILGESVERWDSLPVNADFSYDLVNACNTDLITFTNNSSGAIDSLEWNFVNDTIVYTAIEPEYTYTFLTEGIYSVQLIVFGRDAGNIDTLKLTNIIGISDQVPVAAMSADVTTGDAPLEVLFSDLSTASISRFWDFGDPAVESDTSLIGSPSYIFTDAGTYTVTLTVSNPCGTDVITQDIIVTTP